ncbi:MULTISPECIES: RNA 2',3'-cyclic phosphodiesterase [unclassified Micromonospora]|uniref:RNA 2',3'-cyclic phosphodiesterase n=1 Tax=unclassified Micromonospora TaxID=2617518 RepID=UPI0022B6B2B4|nr:MULTISPECIES: RNA 2',3'-cyclic phosphodiesterase [unclassified Micromonospora]MCZ7421311.1 RNA 2',3'-cyclic phosphodiesterase [Verrucosispora sp. WMMA2121]WBB93994.1 RNA 2',3'-cyclic phosphodiesterase [Verrucosispora sp. WMMC514]
MRLFIAIYPPVEAIAHLSPRLAGLRLAAASAVGTNVRLVDPATAHLTLAFLGEVDPVRLAELRQLLPRAVQAAHGGAAAEAPAGCNGPAVLRLGGGGRFGWGRSTVLWVDVHGDVNRLGALAGAVRTALTAAGFPGDERPFRPHLTIARPGDRLSPADIEADLATLHDYLGPPWPAEELVLVQSRPGPPSRYHRLAAWPL